MIRQVLAPYWHTFYDRMMAGRRKRFYKTMINPGDLCFDVGANIGNRTAIFLDLKAQVVAVEPQPACVQTLTRRFGNQISIVPKGLGAEEGHLPIHIGSISTLSSFSEDWIYKVQQERFATYKWTETITVPVTTLNQLISTYGIPSFCKIDVEGFELQVLQGLTQAIPMLSLEYAVPEAISNLITSSNLLNALSTDVRFNYSPGESMQMALPNYITLSEFRNVIVSQAFEKTRFGDIYVKSICS